MTDSRAERETIVRWSEDPEESMTVYTFRAKHAARLLRAGATLKREGKREGKVVSWTLEMPREWFRWPRKPPKIQRTEEQRRMASETLARARSARKDEGS